MLPVVHATATEALADLTELEREQLITSLATIRARLAVMSGQTPPTPKPRRKRTSHGR
jgi:outer membrane protein TolC